MDFPQPVEQVELVCVKVGGKLRVRITSANYLNRANVQFPRDIRFENRRFRVPASAITLVETRGKWFYTVRNRGSIVVLDDPSAATGASATASQAVPARLVGHAVFEDTDTEECVICMAAPKEAVFLPCFHYYCCEGCAGRVKACPICRQTVTRRINKSLIG